MRFKNLTCLSTDNFLLALRQMSLICTDQSRLEVRYTPRWRWVFTLSIKFSLKIRGGELFNTLFEKIKSLDFSALKVTFHNFAQLEILTKSLFSISAVSEGSFPLAKREQSSAKSKISLSNPDTMSLMYIKNNSGPSLDP